MDYKGTPNKDVLSQKKLALPDWSSIYGLDGDDEIEVDIGVAVGGAGNDLLIGTSRFSTAAYYGSPKGVKIDLTTGKVEDGFGTIDTVVGIVLFQGSGQSDVFKGNQLFNEFWSFSVFDVVDGGEGIDRLRISIKNKTGVPTFTKTLNGWLIDYKDENGQSRKVDSTSFEILEIYRGDVFEAWDLTAPTPRLIPPKSDKFEPITNLPSSKEWKFGVWAIEKLVVIEDVGAWYYPTKSDYHPPGNLIPDMHNAALGDFNGDGYQDILINWVYFPHVLPHNLDPLPTILWGSATGLVNKGSSVFPATTSMHQAYRTFSANLNGDGIDDFVTGAMIDPIWGDASHTAITYGSEPSLAVLGSSSGRFTDVSDKLEGQTLSTGLLNSSFDHATAVGDLNKDGIDDIYSGDNLWISNGLGAWLDKTTIINKFVSGSPMSLDIGDLNNDGANDILALFSDFNFNRTILLNDSKSNLNFTSVQLPVGYYGSNTKDNFAIIEDVNYDGLNDIVVAETRAQPYYIGSAIQILIQQKNGTFIDETNARIDNSKLDQRHGEGNLFYLDANGDGLKDIIHSGDGIAIYLNDGKGKFSLYDSELIPFLRINQIDGYQNIDSDNVVLPGTRANPVDDNHDGIIDLLVQAKKQGITFSATEDQQVALYTIVSTGKEFGRYRSESLLGSPFSDRMYGFSGDDLIDGLAGNDWINGGDDNDTITGNLGDDFIDGGNGLDVAVYSLALNRIAQANYSIKKLTSGEWNVSYAGPNLTIYPALPTEGVDKLSNIERIKFADISVALDISGNAGTTAKILGAVFGKDSISNKNYVGIGLHFLDAGWSYDNLAGLALDAAGVKTNDQIVSLLWTNVIGFKPTSADKQPFIAMLENGMSAGALAHLAADSSFNTANINLVGLAQTGIEYIPV
ncbi:MAG: FG-GAP-like repeat-containing protein [Burkholderiaceae bacterium]